MALTNLNFKKSFSGNGVTTAFSFDIPFINNSHLKVYLTTAGVDTLLTITTHYTVTGAGNPAGGTVTMVTAPATGQTLTIIRDVPVTQETVYVQKGNFPSDSHELALDKLTMIAQQIVSAGSASDRSIKFPITEPILSNSVLPSKADRANTVVGFDNNGDLMSSGGIGTVNVSSFMTPVVQSSDAAEARGFIGSTTVGDAIFTAANAAAARTTLELGSVATLNTRSVMSYRNHLLNPDFSIWQRGTSFAYTETGNYCADRWWFVNVDATSGTVERSDDAVNFAYSLFNNTDGKIAIGQPVELPRTGVPSNYTAGEYVTVSFYYKGASAHNVELYLKHRNGKFDGTNDASFTAVGSNVVAVTDTWARYVVVFLIPAINSSNTVTQLEVYNMQAGSRITAIQIENGTNLSNFLVRNKALELSDCQRYYQKGRTVKQWSSVGVEVEYWDIPYLCEMRVTPTAAITDTTGQANVASSAIIADGTRTGVFSVTTSGIASTLAPFTFTLDAEL
jgi:hypothetical protein